MAGSSLRILVVDDNPSTVESETILLGLMGHEVRAAGNGHDALAEARTFAPDVILMDIGLPDVSGWEVARRLYLAGARRPVLVALTALPGERACEESWQAGFDFHFTKPADIQRIANMLPAIVRRHERRIALQNPKGPADSQAI